MFDEKYLLRKRLYGYVGGSSVWSVTRGHDDDDDTICLKMSLSKLC
jgi:hypothetical protein